MLRALTARIDVRWLLLGVSILLGLLAAWITKQHVDSFLSTIDERSRVPTSEVVVAATDLTPGSMISPDNVAVRSIPREWVAEDALLPHEFNHAAGMLISHGIARGDPILWGYLEQPLTRRPFSAQLGAGRRAITIPVDDINSLSGMLEPGDVIDLFVTFDHRGKRMTAPLLQSVLVLATGSNANAEHRASGGRYGTVTLDASPEEAVKLIAARQQGSISAMLRHTLDDDGQAGVSTHGDLASLLGLTDPAPPAQVPVIFGDHYPILIPKLGEHSDSMLTHRELAFSPDMPNALRRYANDDSDFALSYDSPANNEPRSWPGDVNSMPDHALPATWGVKKDGDPNTTFSHRGQRERGPFHPLHP